MTSKKGLHVILQKLGAIFAGIFREFSQIFKDFVKIFTDFAQIFRNFTRTFDKSRFLHHWISQ